MVIGRWISKKKALVPSFRQAVASARMQFTLAESVCGGRTQTEPARDPPRDEIFSRPTYHLVDESSNGDESRSRKRRRVELGKVVATDLEKRKIVASRVASSPMSGTRAFFMSDAILAGRSHGVKRYVKAGDLYDLLKAAFHLLPEETERCMWRMMVQARTSILKMCDHSWRDIPMWR